ncbi:CocE/NonD family hydrolase [Solirubrobacter phytolaccae]|uniref:CocE/NonD family hydrolase n=1 Tax=Solirubrobacter phytolaccae TaxID=1404360 RepID=A0A9X3NGN5_9ACTN|nr:CocE/NonD family hydrolase [Solirubrobacter phytolaccae]MDA0184762.1 CocE/NonD family hydrolase [Solirubrobacter phytolaccae]
MKLVRRAAGIALLAVTVFASSAQAQTTPQYDYDGAIRERVYIPNGLDADRDGIEDRTAIEIMRPKELTKDVPAIIAPSPYYTSACGQFVGECIGDLDSDGLNDRWPLWYDNFFVPRGYAVILAEMGGTANSTGCAVNGGKEDVQSTKVVIDWLNGRLPGYKSLAGTADPITATWHSGKAAMIGRSYNGTLPNAVAATGVAGLTTIVPIAAISSWYDYSRMGGIIGSTAHYPAWLANYVTDAPRQPICAPVRDAMSLLDGDTDGNMNAFWDERNYRPDADKVKASVFATHCLQDDNVDPDQTSEWWHQLAKHNVPRKLWLCREGHIDPFMTNRAEWMRQLHAWFDHWLYGVQNGIMEEPRVDIENTKDSWGKYADWPLPGSTPTTVHLWGDTQTTTGTLAGRSGGATDTLKWTDQSNMTEANAMNLAAGTTQTNRRVFLSAPLKQDLRLSGSPKIDLRASLDKPQSNLTALLVDYGPSTQITRSGDGVSTPTDAPSDCWGPSSTRKGPDGQVMDFDSCYQQPIKPTVTVTATQGWRISRGILDSSNRESLYSDVATVPGTEYRFQFPIMPVDYTFPAGHRIGIVLIANLNALQRNGTTGTTVTLNTKQSTVSLPIVGGFDAAVSAGAFADTTAVTQPVGGTVPATLALSLRGVASFGTFTPGLDKEYTAATDATVISTAGDAALTVSDPGHLTNGAFSLAEPLRVELGKTAWTGPTSNETVPITFKQRVKETDPLRTGAYTKTLTFTLSTTTP